MGFVIGLISVLCLKEQGGSRREKRGSSQNTHNIYILDIKSHIEHFFYTVEEQVLGGEGVGHTSMLMIL